MARKKRRSSAAKRKKKSKISSRKKSPAAARKRKARRTRSKGAGSTVARAYRVVVDTIKGTDRLRNKLEPPGTSETE